ncbi:MAG: hypothetical protein IJ752_08955 [Alphaproteobacteria bacterium]|nr:hypothetical protein [Alphaproteobacteria bacterium]
MPITLRQSVLFTVITAMIMVYLMCFYNALLHSSEVSVDLLIPEASKYWGEVFAAVPLAFVFAGNLIPKGINRILTEKYQPLKPFLIPCAVVCVMAPSMTLFVQIRLNGWVQLSAEQYFFVLALNFIAALPAQIFIAGPLARFLFRKFMMLHLPTVAVPAE